MAIDKEKVQRSISMLLEAIGEDPAREGLLNTPKRIAKMYEEFLSDNSQELTSFTATEINNDLVSVKGISFCSMCEHHLMPFYGKVDIIYIPNGKILGLSKFARIVDGLSRKLQVQEYLTSNIAEAIVSSTNSKFVTVNISATHLCMVLRGVKQYDAVTKTFAVRGDNKDDINLLNRAKMFVANYEK